MRIALEHLHALMSRDTRDFHGVQALLKQSGRCLVTQVMPSKLFDVGKGLAHFLKASLPDAEHGIGRSLEDRPFKPARIDVHWTEIGARLFKPCRCFGERGEMAQYRHCAT
ncbi:hypothetical protein WJ63_03455 [Burkholderia pyrrocinia]|nr:hypothetical protein WJ63_03455 [Burkholderia pyrrocinia]